jgi:Flp pilus assembly protein TadB
MGQTLLYTLCLVAGLLILFRDRWLHGRQRAKTEAQERFEHLLSQEQLGEDLGGGQDPEELQERSAVVRKLASRLDDSRLFDDEEGRTFLENLERWLIQAGWRDRFTPTQALAYAMMIWALGIGLPLVLALLGGFPKILLVVVILFSALYPILKLRGAIKERQDAISAEVPFFIQQLYMTLSTGMATIDEAIVRVARTSEEDPYDSVLAREFGQAQVEYRLGARSFEDAIRDIGRRTGVLSVENLCEAMVQGYRTGAEMDRVLLEYSAQAQELWRQDMRNYKNRKEPMVTIGLVFTMFGAFIIWATPMMLQLLDTLTLF